MTYPKVDTAGAGLTPSPDFPSLEQAVLAYWEENDTFRKSVEQREAGEDGTNEFVFNDGPPFANGLPHYGHLLTGYVKDVVPRYQTMRGRRVERRFGWDTHGLPAELEAMAQLGIKTKDEILELGIEGFNDKCRASVLKYTDEWREYVTRQARWVDFDNDYKTLNVGYMESVIWAFKQLHDKGLAYEGFRVLPYCWNDETPLSNHELRMDEEVYQVRRDPAVTVGLRILPEGEDGSMPAAGGEDLLNECKALGIDLLMMGAYTRRDKTAIAADLERIRALVDAWLAGRRLAAVAHRVVHGGAAYFEPVAVDGEVLARLRSLYPRARTRGIQRWLVWGRDRGSSTVRPRLRAEIKNGRVRALIVSRAAGLGFADPEGDVYPQVVVALTPDESGGVPPEAVDQALQDLAQRKPYLRGAVAPPLSVVNGSRQTSVPHRSDEQRRFEYFGGRTDHFWGV